MIGRIFVKRHEDFVADERSLVKIFSLWTLKLLHRKPSSSFFDSNAKWKASLSRTISIGSLLLLAFVSARGAQAQTEDVAKKLTELENSWVAALVKADAITLDAILVDTYVDTEEGGHRSDKAQTLAILKS